jgi:DNA/RNA endonuclease YhcR with UshA esterase domain
MTFYNFRLVLVCAAGVAAVAVFSQPARAAVRVKTSITAEEARDHVQETNTVCGVVTTTKYLEKSKTKPTFLDLDRPYPNQIFTAVIPDSVRGKFKGAPEEIYKGRTICVTGLITVNRNKPQIVVNDPSQIRIEVIPSSAPVQPPATPATP